MLSPLHCICPTENYTCTVNHGLALAWQTNTTDRDILEHSETKEENTQNFDQGGFQVTIIREQDTFSSTLHVKDMDLNNTNLTCEGVYGTEMGGVERINNSTAICIVGKQLSHI